jgi:hypothetical protein
VAQEPLHHIAVDAVTQPAGRRRVTQHVRTARLPESARQPVEHLLGIRVRHRPPQRRTEQIHEHHLRLHSLGHIVAFVLVVGIQRDQIGGDRHEAVMPGLRQDTVGVVHTAADMHVRTLHAAAHHAGGGQQMHIAAVQPERLTDPQPRTRQQRDQETVPGTRRRSDHPADLLIAEVLIARLGDLEAEHGRLDLAPLARFAGIEAGRGEAQQLRLGQQRRRSGRHPAVHGAEPQELPHHRHDRVRRPPRPVTDSTGPHLVGPVLDRRLDQPPLQPGQIQEAGSPPVQPPHPAVTQIQSDPPRICSLGVRRTPPRPQRSQERHRLGVQIERTGVDHHPPHHTGYRRNSTLRHKVDIHVTNTTTRPSDAYRTPPSTIPAGESQNKRPSSLALPQIILGKARARDSGHVPPSGVGGQPSRLRRSQR